MSSRLRGALAAWRSGARAWPRDCSFDTTPLDGEARSLAEDLVMNPGLARAVGHYEILGLLSRALASKE